jgi:chromatin remodeling complex protein RSC6
MAKSAKKAAKKTAKKAPKKAAKKAAKKAPRKAAKKAPKKKSARKPNAGSKPAPRTEMIKRIWDYIKKNKLQDSKNRRMINADAKLKVLFDGKSQVSMFELAKVVSKHVK